MHIAKSKKLEKQYKKLPIGLQKQFAERLRLYLKDKNHSLLHAHSLAGEYKGLWSFNVSADLRVIFDDSYTNVVILVAIGSHSELYG